jgi:hypothetical protein
MGFTGLEVAAGQQSGQKRAVTGKTFVMFS